MQGSTRSGLREGTRHLGSSRGTTAIIVLAALLLVAFAWAAAFYQSDFERRTAERGAMAQVTFRAMMLQQYVTRTLDAANIATLHVAEMDQEGRGAALRGSAGRPAGISGPIARNPSFLGLSVADARGEIVATTVRGESPVINVRRHPAFTPHIAGDADSLFVSKPGFSRVLGRNSVWLSRRLNRSDGTFDGVVAINMDPAQLTGIYDQATISPSDIASVVGLDGIIRSRRTRNGISSGEDISKSRAFAVEAQSPNTTYLGRGAFDGQPRYIGQRRIAGYPLFVSYSVSQDEVLEPARHRGRLFLLAAGLVTLLGALLALILIVALRRREQRATVLAAAKAQLEEAQRVGQIGDWAFRLNSTEARWSPELFRLYERDPQLGAPSAQDFEQWLHPASAKAHWDAVARTLETAEAFSWEVMVRLPSGGVRTHLISAVPTRDEQGRITGLHGTTQDVTERKKLESLQAEVAHLGRVEAMNAMAATLAHELNQPLTAASNYLFGSRRILLKPEAPREDAMDGLEAAREQIGLAAEIIRRARAMVAKEPTKMAPVPIAEIVDDAITLLAAGEKLGGIQLHRALCPEASCVLADRIQVQQVVMNLARNACEAASEAAHPQVTIASKRAEDGLVCISIEDNGPGFSGDADQLFSPFVTGKSHGLGLGLSISRTIIEAHGGRIWAENRHEGGGRVSFTLPFAAP